MPDAKEPFDPGPHYDSIWTQVLGAESSIEGVGVLSGERAGKIIEAVVRAFVEDRTHRWWWATLKAGTVKESLEFELADFALSAIPARADVAEHWYLVVTNEEAEPAGVLEGPLSALLELIGELPPFEYVLTDAPVRRGFFDSHHNVLYVVAALDA